MISASIYPDLKYRPGFSGYYGGEASAHLEDIARLLCVNRPRSKSFQELDLCTKLVTDLGIFAVKVVSKIKVSARIVRIGIYELAPALRAGPEIVVLRHQILNIWGTEPLIN